MADIEEDEEHLNQYVETPFEHKTSAAKVEEMREKRCLICRRLNRWLFDGQNRVTCKRRLSCWKMLERLNRRRCEDIGRRGEEEAQMGHLTCSEEEATKYITIQNSKHSSNQQ
ncbi:hypothetical protein P8452_37980 [Trifolium repens]|jgi:hypothetical protein|nr:hypothetical protein P8452_37980 [Trifolium repens]